MKLSNFFIYTLFACCALNIWALEDIDQFPDQQLLKRYQVLTQELRCPKCQNQNLADSNSMIAGDLKVEVKRLLLEGKTDQQIEDHLIARYGEFVLYRPRLNKSTQLLWVTPILLLFTGIVILLRIVFKQRNKAQQVDLDASEAQRLDQLLKQNNGDSGQ